MYASAPVRPPQQGGMPPSPPPGGSQYDVERRRRYAPEIEALMSTSQQPPEYGLSPQMPTDESKSSYSDKAHSREVESFLKGVPASEAAMSNFVQRKPDQSDKSFIGALEMEVRNARTQLINERNIRTEMAGRLKALSSRLDLAQKASRDQQEELRRTRDSKVGSLREAEEAKSRLCSQEQIASKYEQMVRDLQPQLKERMEEVRMQSDQIATLVTKLNRKEEELSESRKEVEEMQDLARKHQMAAQEEAGKAAVVLSKADRHDKLLVEVDRLQKELEEMKMKHKEQLMEKKKEMAEGERAFVERESALANANRERDEAVDRLKRLQEGADKEVERLRDEALRVRGEVDRVTKEKAKLVEVMATLKSALKDSTSLNDAAKEEIHYLRNRNADLEAIELSKQDLPKTARQSDLFVSLPPKPKATPTLLSPPPQRPHAGAQQYMSAGYRVNPPKGRGGAPEVIM